MSTAIEIRESVVALIEAAFGSTYPDAAVAAEVFHAALSRFEPEVLRDATKRVLTGWSQKQRPKPSDILEKAREITRPKQAGFGKLEELSPVQRANQLLHRDIGGIKARADGLGHAYHQFVCDHNRAPGPGDGDAVMACHERIFANIRKWERKLGEGVAPGLALRGLVRMVLAHNDDKWFEWWGEYPKLAAPPQKLDKGLVPLADVMEVV